MFYCLERHLAKCCTKKSPCVKCKGRHTELLHQEKRNISHAITSNNSKEGERRNETKNAIPDCSLNTAEDLTTKSPAGSDCAASVPLMELTALTKSDNDHPSEEITFCALLDTGAYISLCTRQLAEKLWKWDPKDKVNIKFLENLPECFPCMTQTLHLKHSDNSVKLQSILLFTQDYHVISIFQVRRH